MNLRYVYEIIVRVVFSRLSQFIEASSFYTRKDFKHLHPVGDCKWSENRLKDFHFDSALSGADVASGFVSIDIGESPYWQYIVRVETFPVVHAKRMYTFDHGVRKSLSTLPSTFVLQLISLNCEVGIKHVFD